MDRFYEYWEYFPSADPDIGRKLVRYIKLLGDNFDDDEVNNLSRSTLQYLRKSLMENPYITFEIIKILFSQKFPSKNRSLEEICYQALHALITPDNAVDSKNLYSLLSIIELPQNWMDRISTELLPKLVDLKRFSLINSNVYLALISRSHAEDNFLKEFINCERDQMTDSDFTLKSLFLETVYHKKHWIYTFMKYSNKLGGIYEEMLYQKFNLFKMTTFGFNKKLLKVESWLEELKNTNLMSSQDLFETNHQKFCFLELQRRKNFLDLLKNYSSICDIKKCSYFRSFDVFPAIIENVELTPDNYQEISEVIARNEEIAQKQLLILEEFSESRELDIFNEYIIVKTYFLIIIRGQNHSASPKFQTDIAFIHQVFEKIDNPEKLIEIVELIFTLLFLHSEQFSAETYERFSLQIHSRFICDKHVVELILDSLKFELDRMIGKSFYQNSDDAVKVRCKIMNSYIESAILRFSVIRDFQRDCETILNEEFTFERHKNFITQNTSSEIEEAKSKSSESRKSSDKTKSSKTSSDCVMTDKYFGNDNQDAASESDVSDDDYVSSQNVISKMLMSPSSLVQICLAKGDLGKAQHILKLYSMESSDLSEEVKCLENIQKARKVLNRIVACDNSMESSTSNSETIQIIDSELQVASYSTKFMDALEKFSDSIEIPQSAKDLEFIRNHLESHPYLKQYDEDIIDVLPMVDLLISLPCKQNLREAIYNKILGKFEYPDNEGESQIGYFQFLKNIMECLTIYKNIFGEDITIPELLQTEIYSLDPEIYEKKLRNLRNASELMTFKIEDLKNDLKVGKFVRYTEMFEPKVDYVKKMLSFTRNFRKMTKKFSKTGEISEDVFKINVDNVFCELIYQENVGPDKLETFAHNMNVNLVQVLALGAVEPILIEGMDNEDHLIENFLLSCRNSSFSNKKLEAQLKLPKYRGENFKISNQKNVLNYVRQENYLLSFLMKELHEVDYQSASYELNFLENMKELESIKLLASIFGGNLLLTCLHYDHVDLRILLIYLRNSEDYEENLRILEALNPRQYKRHRSLFNQLKDFYIERILSGERPEKFQHLEKVSNINFRAELLLKYLIQIPSIHYIRDLIEGILNTSKNGERNVEYKNGLEIWMKKLKLYKKVENELNFEEKNLSWLKIMELNAESPEIALTQLLENKNLYKLCFDWIDLYPLVECPVKLGEFRKIFLNVLNNFGPHCCDRIEDIYSIIETLSKPKVLEMYHSLLPDLRNLQSFQYIVNYLDKNDDSQKIIQQKYQISAKIYQELPKIDSQLWGLAKFPLLLLEQLLMNLKIEIVAKVIREIQPLLKTERFALNEHQNCEKCSRTFHRTFTNFNAHKISSESAIYSMSSSHDNVLIKRDCIDLLLRVYASKALDFKILDGNQSLYASSLDVSSVDSLAGIFQMPKEIPRKAQWVPDSEALNCMVCKQVKFTLLNRRHHCRRCGRVVCGSCSHQKRKIPEVYADLMVRVCTDCFKSLDVQEQSPNETERSPRHSMKSHNSLNSMDWHLSGVLKHDNLVREDFSYEYSPNVGLCVAICDLHSSNENLNRFLVYHCQRLELLLRPIQPGKVNPEIDYLLVAQMLYCLALTTRKFENSTYNEIMEHAEVVLMIVRNGCESLLPAGPLNSGSLRKLTDALVRIEKFELAVDFSLKCGFPKSGVLAAWGISCLKAGMFDTAREKFAYCLTRVKEEEFKENKDIVATINGQWESKVSGNSTRQNKSPPLVVEIKSILENLAITYKEEAFQENIKRHSIPNIQEVRIICKKKDVILCEPAVNIKNTLANLRNIADGCYDDIPNLAQASPKQKKKTKLEETHQMLTKNRYYQELMFYLLNYGGHIEIMQFLLDHGFLKEVLKYLLIHKIEKDIFIKFVYIFCLRRGKASTILENMKELDPSLKIWEKHIKDICSFLEQKNLLNSLYHLQIILNDPVRASMTCVRFYYQNCLTFSELHNNSFHLVNAQKHLQSQLEISDWKQSIKERRRRSSSAVSEENGTSLLLKLDVKTINGHINTICRQIEVAKFLANAEKAGRDTIGILKKVYPKNALKKSILPTLFGNNQECSVVAMMVLICGKNVEEGFGLSYRIIQDCNLRALKVYETTGNFLGASGRLEEIVRLIENIKSNDAEQMIPVCDQIIISSVESAKNFYGANALPKNKQTVENLINGISDATKRLEIFFATGHLKAAYLLAVRLNDEFTLKKIYEQAKVDNNDYLVKLCERKFVKSSDSNSVKSDFSSKS